MDKKELVCIYNQFDTKFVPVWYDIIETKENYLKIERKGQQISEKTFIPGFYNYIGRELVKEDARVSFYHVFDEEYKHGVSRESGTFKVSAGGLSRTIRSGFSDWDSNNDKSWFIESYFNMSGISHARAGYLLYILDVLCSNDVKLKKVYEHYEPVVCDSDECRDEWFEEIDRDGLDNTFNREVMLKTKRRRIGEIWITKEDAEKYNLRYKIKNKGESYGR